MKKEFSDRQLRDAVREGDILPVFQPVVSLKDGQMQGAEVLARWYLPGGVAIAPNSFIPRAEALGLIVPLTTGLMKRVSNILSSLCRCKRLTFSLKIGFNASPSCLVAAEFERECRQFIQNLRGTGITLAIELTEREPITDMLCLPLQRLRAAGATIVLDDYGTGYATSDVLQIVAPGIVKTDRSLTRLAGKGDPQGVLTNSLHYLQGYPGIEVLAEGVETADESAWLRARGVTLAQGYAYSFPVSSAAFLNLAYQSQIDTISGF